MLDFRKKILEDLPFSYPKPDNRCKSILAGESAKDFIKELFINISGSMQGAIMTPIIGPPGAGKSQIIYHTEYLSNEKKEYKGLTILFSPRDEPFSETEILERIVTDTIFLQKVDECGMGNFSASEVELLERLKRAGEGAKISLEKRKLVNLIKSVVGVLQRKYGKSVGIVLAVDNVDEYIRKMESKKAIQQFLGVFRLLIEDIDKGLCVIFATTIDAFHQIEDAIEDRTLRRRFIIMSDIITGNPRELRPFSLHETYEMVSLHMQNWAQRRGVELPEDERCMGNSFNIYPFTSKAIQLLCDAGAGIPGQVSCGCKYALIRKYNFSEETIIDERDAVDTIQHYATFFENFKEIKDKLRLIDLSPQINRDLEHLGISMKGRYGNYEGVIKDPNTLKGSFRTFLKSLMPEADITDAPVAVDKYDSKRYLCDHLINLKEKKICTVVVKGLQIRKSDAKKIATTLVNREATHGIFINVVDESRYRGSPFFDPPAAIDFKDHVNDIDYGTVKIFFNIKEDDIWKIVGFPNVEESKRQIFAQYLDKNVGIQKEILNLMDAKPSKIRILSGGDLRMTRKDAWFH